MARPLSPDDPILSAVVPVRNEEANIAPLVAEIETSLKGSVYEIVHVDDGGTNGTSARLRGTAARGPLRWIMHGVSCGQRAAVVIGVRAARGPIIATLDRLRAGIVDLAGEFWLQRRWRRPEVAERGP